MNSDITQTIATKRPQEFDPIELEKFCKLVLSEGQVNANTLSEYVENAERLAFAYYNEELAAVAAIKKAQLSYRKNVKRKSGTDIPLEEISREFGYVVVAPNHRGKGLSGILADALLRNDSGMMFATSITDNSRMHRTLYSHGFKKSGNSYPSTEHPGQELSLFVRLGF